MQPPVTCSHHIVIAMMAILVYNDDAGLTVAIYRPWSKIYFFAKIRIIQGEGESDRKRGIYVQKKGLRMIVTAVLLIVLSAAILLWVPTLLSPQPRAAHLDMNGSSTVKLRTMSYNIHHGVGMDGLLDLDRIADVIAEAEPDIVGLQEVDKHYSGRSNWEDQGKYLAEKLDMHYAYGVNLNYDPVSQSPLMAQRQYGTAILSKYPIEAYENVHLDSLGKEQRGLLRATIQVDGVQAHFYTTHLGLTPEERTVQVKQVMELVSQQKGPSIIVGDFNAWSLSKAMKPILSEYWDAFAKKSYANTSNSKFPYQRIDYILAKADRVQFSDQKVLRTKASDHLPIVADITLTVHNANTPNASAGD